MLHGVAAAFSGAGIANLGAEFANALGKVGIARQFPCGERANIRAAAVEIDAASHHFHVIFLEAGTGAMFARGDTGLTRVDTALVFVLGNGRHASSSLHQGPPRASFPSGAALIRM